MIEFPDVIPLLIDGEDFRNEDDSRVYELPSGHRFQGADSNACSLALETSARAFESWSQTTVQERQTLLRKVAQLLREQKEDIKKLLLDEIHTSELWAEIITMDSINHCEQAAAILGSQFLNGQLPPRPAGDDSIAMILNEPLGVVLGIAPWNAPIYLGFRAIIAPVATGNTVILKGSELSPRTHFYIASVLRKAGFPPGVLNLILHRPEDAEEVCDQLISHDAVRKCNFTGSTNVGRAIAAKCGQHLKPVLLELGGKNTAIVLEDGDVERAAEAVLMGATINNGQICMSTDTVYVHNSVLESFTTALKTQLNKHNNKDEFNLISSKSYKTATTLIEDARSKGAEIITPSPSSPSQTTSTPTPKSTSPTQSKSKSTQSSPENTHKFPFPPTIINPLTETMTLHNTESFAPLIAIQPISNPSEALSLANDSGYGLSSSIWTANTYAGLDLARKLRSGAVHVNGMTVHDEQVLPHGGVGLSGFGRFGGEWGLREFVQTKVVILNR